MLKILDGATFLRDRQILPDEAGVYAFFDKLDADPHNATRFRSSLENLVERAQDKQVFINHPSERQLGLTISPANNTLGEREEVLDHLDCNEHLRFQFQPLLQALSVWRQPLYIGMTDNIRTRLRQHANGSDAVMRIQDNGLEFEDLVISILFVQENLANASAHSLLELIAGTVCCPSEVERL